MLLITPQTGQLGLFVCFFDLVSLLNKSILGKEKTELALGTEAGEVSEPPAPVVWAEGSLVKLMLLFVLLDDCLVCFLEVLGQNNVAVLSDSQHPALLRDDS